MRAIVYVFIMILMVMTPGGIHAQSKGKPTKEEMDAVYIRAMNNLDTDKCLIIADTLYDMAKKADNLKYMSTALTIKTQHLTYNGDMKVFRETCEQLASLARGTEINATYYFAKGMIIEREARDGHLAQAVEKLETLRKEAKADSDPKAIAGVNEMMAIIYYQQGNREIGDSLFLVTIDLLKKVSDMKLDGNFYIYMAQYALLEGDCISALKWGDRSIKEGYFPENKPEGYAIKCQAYYLMNNRPMFMKSYRQMQAEQKGFTGESGGPIDVARAYKMAWEGDYEGALELISSFSIDDDTNYYIANIATRQGDWKRAFEAEHKQRLYNDSLHAAVMKTELNDVNAKMNNMSLQLQNANLLMKTQHEKNLLRTFILIGMLMFLTVAIVAVMYHSSRRQKDMTKLRLTNEDLVKARQEAEAANKVKTEFLQNMTHEIRTPLNAVAGFSQLLCMPGMELSDEEKTEYMTHIQGNTDMITTLVNDILNVAELDSGTITLNVEQVSPVSICRNTMTAVQHRCPAGVDLRFESSVAEDLLIASDGKRIQQILTNFLTNAEKHTTQGSITLRLVCEESSRSLVFSVEDTGTGIPAGMAEMIFERFTKLDSFKQGTGLGLSICRMLAERLGGTVSLDTAYTDGARFVFELPMANK